MSTGITFAKIVVAFALLAVFFGGLPLLEFIRQDEASPSPAAQVRAPSAPVARVAEKRVPRAITRAAAKPTRGSKKRGAEAAVEIYQVPAASVLPAFLRAPLDSVRTRVEEPVRALLRSSVKQNGVELIPAASTLLGKVLDVIPASRWQPRGRIVVGFYFIEHAGTGTRMRISARPLIFEPVDATGNRRSVDVRVNAGEILHVTLTEPLIIRLPA